MRSLIWWKSVLLWPGFVLPFCLITGILAYVFFGTGVDKRKNIAGVSKIQIKEVQAAEQVQYEGVKISERTTFDDVFDGGYVISFVDVWLTLYQGGSIKRNVLIDIDSGISKAVAVEIDSSIPYTAITVFPKPNEMRFKPSSAIYAEKVILYVPEKMDKRKWEKWLVAVERKRLAYLKRQETPTPTRVIPH